MSALRTKIRSLLKENKPSLSDSSLKTYASTLVQLYKNLTDDFSENTYDPSVLSNKKTVLKFLNDPDNKRNTPPKRKSILSSLVVLTEDETFRKEMNKDIEKYKDEIDKQEKTPAQKESWVTKEEIETKYKELERFAKNWYRRNPKPSHSSFEDLQKVQNFIIVAILGGIYISPRRSKDYVNFKIRNVNTESDNYMERNSFIFNSFKGSDTKGQQRVQVPPKLRYIIEKWKQYNPTDHLLFNANFNPLSNVTLNQRLNHIFDNRKVAINQMRHTYLTELHKTKEFDTVVEQKKVMKDMGSSVGMISTYVKVN